MKTITKTIYLQAAPASWEPDGYSYDMYTFESERCIQIMSMEVSMDIPDNFDLTNSHIDILKAEKQKIYAEAQIKTNNLEEQIQSLLAIEDHSNES